MFKLAVTLCLAALALAQAADAQAVDVPAQAVNEGNDPPTFRARTHLVQVDVVVRNRNGPVEGLQKSDFTVLDEGKPQPITVFSVTSSKHPAQIAVPLPPGAVSNRRNQRGEPLANATILLIDRLNTPVNNQLYANRRIVQFLQSRGARDRLGIYVLGNSIRVVQDLTSDPDRLDRAVRNIKPQEIRRLTDDVQVDPTGDAATDAMIADSLMQLQAYVVEDKVRATRDALIAIAHHLAKVPGRKNLIWISGSFPLIIQYPHQTINFSAEVNAAARALNDADVAVFPVDARGLMFSRTGASAEIGPQQAVGNCIAQGTCGPSPDGLLRQLGPSGADSMNALAGLTGGRAYYNTNGIEDSIRKALDDSEVTYTLGFTPSDDTFDDKFHKLAVKVARNGVDIRFRKGYFASQPQPGPLPGPASVSQLMLDPLDATAIGLTVDAQANPVQPGQYTLRMVLDLRDIQLAHGKNISSGAVNISFFMVGSKSVSTTTHKFEIPDDRLAGAFETGLEIKDVLAVDGKPGDLRVVVQDLATGVAGSVRISLKK